VVDSGALLKRCRGLNPYRGFESPPLRHPHVFGGHGPVVRISGLVAHPLEIKWDELRTLPTATVMATIECAGNVRVFLSPKVNGSQWERRAGGNAVWTGVPLGTSSSARD
jgi:DMSO/TMAO reductase YedYZ molybdopterin-dependent catalytic subunit